MLGQIGVTVGQGGGRVTPLCDPRHTDTYTLSACEEQMGGCWRRRTVVLPLLSSITLSATGQLGGRHSSFSAFGGKQKSVWGPLLHTRACVQAHTHTHRHTDSDL